MLKKVLVQGPGHTKCPLGHRVAYQALFKIKMSKKLNKKLCSQNLNYQNYPFTIFNSILQEATSCSPWALKAKICGPRRNFN